MPAGSLAGLPFAKMHGAGNDFVMVHARDLQGRGPLDRQSIAALCNRRTGIGADGLIIVSNDPGETDLQMHYYNADGGRAEMCGNGARCTVAFAHGKNLIGDEATLQTDAGTLAVRVHGSGDVEVELTPLRGVMLDVELADAPAERVHCCNTGVPHAVIPVDDVDRIDIAAAGPLIRRHPRFAPAGTNVDWVSPAREHATWLMRTYERGVEAETLACGTGAAAVAAVLVSLGRATSPVAIRTRGGDLLQVTVDLAAGRLALRGPAVLTFEGNVSGEVAGDA